MATACLFLGCKVQESPKALKDVMIAMWSMRHRGKIAELDRMKERVSRQKGLRCAVVRNQ